MLQCNIFVIPPDHHKRQFDDGYSNRLGTKAENPMRWVSNAKLEDKAVASIIRAFKQD